jgi:hypothetical protein
MKKIRQSIIKKLLVPEDSALKILFKWNSLSFVHLVLFVIGIFISSCEQLIEKDITNNELILIAPGDNLKTIYSTQTFWWEELDGALTYNLQVVSPSFESIEIIMADTLLSKNKFTINLFPGNFEWRVRAQNGSYKSQFFLRTLLIDSTMDLKGHKVTLISPVESSFTNSLSTLLKWQKLYNADNYSIEVHNNTWTGDLVFSSLSVTSDTLTVKGLSEGIYLWGIKAWNRTSATDFNSRKVTIDRTDPGLPSLIEPKDKATLLNLPVNLSWNRASDTGTPLKDSLIISSDSLFSTGNIVVKRIVLETSFDDAVRVAGTYFWKVKSIDAARNQGLYSRVRSFKVQSK